MAGISLYETHSHTPLCKHAVGDPQDYAALAFRRGFHGLLVTCHNPMPAGFSPGFRMSVDQFDDYLQMVFRARQIRRGRIDVRLGIEADYLPGYERWLEHQLQLADFQYVLGSVHPHVSEFRQRYGTGSALETQRAYFRLLAQAAETRLFDCLSHPDIIKNEQPEQWRPEAILDDLCRALDRIAATGVAMELNTSGKHKEIPEMNPFPQMLVEMRRREIPVVIGADAHEPERVGEGFQEALDLLERCGYDCIAFYINRVRTDVPIAAAREGLQPRHCTAGTAAGILYADPTWYTSAVA
jgi:histidinol-phosphatase (PHP family)